MLIRSKGGAVVRAQASHQCGPGSNPGINAICGLSLLLVLSILRFQFPSPRKPLSKSNSIWNAGHVYIRTLKCFVSERVTGIYTLQPCWLLLLFPLLFQDKHNKVFLNWLISQRKKKLGHLKNGRFERYLVLSKELDLPLLESPHTKWNKYKFRKFKIGVEIKEKKRFPKWRRLE